MIPKITTKLSSFFNFFKDDIDSYSIQYPESMRSMLDNDPEVFEIGPEGYLEYAQLDIKVDDDRGFINALGNVKRAIECQSEIILYSFGIPYKKIDFPRKIECIAKMGISPSDILTKINKIRIDLEHYHKNPDPNAVKDSIQIAQLFFYATTLQLKNFNDHFCIFNLNEKERFKSLTLSDGLSIPIIYNGVMVRLSDDPGVYEFELINIKNGVHVESIKINPNDGDDYLKLIKLFTDIGMLHNFDGKLLLKRFISELD
jgi:hypothetical protein